MKQTYLVPEAEVDLIGFESRFLVDSPVNIPSSTPQDDDLDLDEQEVGSIWS